MVPKLTGVSVLHCRYEKSLMDQSGSVSVRAAMVVMQSLTKNGRKVFWILLQHQKEHSADSDYNGAISFAPFPPPLRWGNVAARAAVSQYSLNDPGRSAVLSEENRSITTIVLCWRIHLQESGSPTTWAYASSILQRTTTRACART